MKLSNICINHSTPQLDYVEKSRPFSDEVSPKIEKQKFVNAMLSKCIESDNLANKMLKRCLETDDLANSMLSKCLESKELPFFSNKPPIENASSVEAPKFTKSPPKFQTKPKYLEDISKTLKILHPPNFKVKPPTFEDRIKKDYKQICGKSFLN